MKKLFLAGAFLACIPAANWLIGNVGTRCIPNGPCLIPVGFGFMAPSGVLLIGAALALRDAVQEMMGRAWVFALLVTGSALSLIFSPPALAVASATAFFMAELADWAVYDRLRRRAMAWAVLTSGMVGAVLDSLLFSAIAFGTVAWAPGLILAKLYASIIYACYLSFYHKNK